jgi:hypothetical protein
MNRIEALFRYLIGSFADGGVCYRQNNQKELDRELEEWRQNALHGKTFNRNKEMQTK